MTKNEAKPLIKMHENIVRDILDAVDVPFCRVETHWYWNGQKRMVRGKIWTVKCDPREILISSYIDINGRTVRISNHDKGSGNYTGITIDVRYNNAGQIQEKSAKIKAIRDLI